MKRRELCEAREIACTLTRGAKHMLAISLLAAMLFGPVVGEAQVQINTSAKPVIDGVVGIKFGASKDEAKKIIMRSMPGVTVSNESADGFRVSRGSFEGLNVSWWGLRFADDKFCWVHIRLLETKDSDVAFARYQEAKRILTLRYGAPTEGNEGSNKEVTKWTFPSAIHSPGGITITCRTGRTSAPSSTVVVEYEHKELHAQWKLAQGTTKPQSKGAAPQPTPPRSLTGSHARTTPVLTSSPVVPMTTPARPPALASKMWHSVVWREWDAPAENKRRIIIRFQNFQKGEDNNAIESKLTVSFRLSPRGDAEIYPEGNYRIAVEKIAVEKRVIFDGEYVVETKQDEWPKHYSTADAGGKPLFEISFAELRIGKPVPARPKIKHVKWKGQIVPDHP